MQQPVYHQSSEVNSSMHEFKLNLIGDSSQSSNYGQTNSNVGDDYEYRISKELEEMSLASDGTSISIFDKSSQMAKDQSG
jgi:hypothetical protein